jgi:hypothetical protein
LFEESLRAGYIGLAWPSWDDNEVGHSDGCPRAFRDPSTAIDDDKVIFVPEDFDFLVQISDRQADYRNVGLRAVAHRCPIERCRLWISIDEKDVLSLVGKVRSKIRRDRALARTTFLVHHTNNHNNLPPRKI